MPYGATTIGISGTPGGAASGPGTSGMFSWYQPAQLFNLRNSPIIKAVSAIFRGRATDPADTTLLGTPATAAPSLYRFNLLGQRYERQAILSDIRKLEQDDPRLAKANKKFAREATRKGI